MGNFNPTYKDRVRFSLYHEEFGTVQITEPENWNEDEKELARNEDYHGIFSKFSNSLLFVQDGADLIKLVRKLYGINAKIKLIKEEMHPQTDLWVLAYTGFLDLAEYSTENKKVSVKFNSGGLEQSMKARENEKIEVERLDTIAGREIAPLETRNLRLDGREIFLESEFDISPQNDQANVQVETNAGNTRNQTCGIPLRIVANSHQGILNQPTPQSTGSEQVGNLDMMILFDMQQTRVFDIDLDISLDAFFQQYENVQWCRYKVCLTVYQNGFDFDLKNRTVLHELRSENPPETNGTSELVLPSDYDAPYPQFTRQISTSYQNQNFTLLAGESAAVEVFLKSDMYTDNNAGVRCFARNIVASCSLKEDSFDEATSTKVVLSHEMGERLVEIMTDKEDAFYSKIFGRTDIGYDQDGEGSLTGIAHGFWIRQFDEFPLSDGNKYKRLTTTWKDYVQSMETIHRIGVGIENFGFKERVRVEDLSYFYNNNVLIRLPNQIKNVKRETATEFFYSNIVIGYEKGGEYEEAMGLDEYNALSTFTTVIEAVVNEFRRVSKYRADVYGPEFARRKSIFKNPTEDTRYDLDNFIFDMKRDFDNFKQRVWQDDFESEPEGVFSPSTATNLRWTPFNLMRYKHNCNIASALIAYPIDYIKHGSSTANTKLKTKFSGQPQYQESDDIVNTELGKARFDPEWVNFEHEIDFDLNQQIEGVTVILGEEIRNVYGLVEYTNEDNILERGFLFNLKPNGAGQWKILKSNR